MWLGKILHIHLGNKLAVISISPVNSCYKRIRIAIQYEARILRLKLDNIPRYLFPLLAVHKRSPVSPTSGRVECNVDKLHPTVLHCSGSPLPYCCGRVLQRSGLQMSSEVTADIK